MTIRHIRVFLAVCEAGCSMTRAAEILHMTQPAVSLAVAELESYYDIKLFDRISRRLYLSEAGEKMREYAEAVVLMFDDMEKTVREWGEKGEIRVGASISIGSKLLPAYTAVYKKIRPETKVSVKINRSDILEEALLKNEIDFALIEGIVHDRGLVSEDFMEDSLALIASVELYKNGAVLKPEEFLASDILLREHGSGTREVFESALSAASYPLPEPVWESLSTAALIHAASAGLGIAVVPRRMVADNIQNGEVSEISIENIAFARKYKIVYHKDKHLTRAAQDFIDLCRKSAAE